MARSSRLALRYHAMAGQVFRGTLISYKNQLAKRRVTIDFYMSDEKKDNALDLHVVVFAGPNGSGKTSPIDAIKQTGLATVRGVYPLPAYFINPDQVAAH